MLYRGNLPKITADVDSALPSDYDDAICLYAAYKLFKGVRDNNSANTFLIDYEQEINTLRLRAFNTDDLEVSYPR